MQKNIIICPECGHQFSVDEVFSKEMERIIFENTKNIQLEFEQKYQTKENILKKSKDEFQQKLTDLENQKNEFDKLIKDEVEKKRKQIYENIKIELEGEKQEEILKLKNSKQAEIIDLKNKVADMEMYHEKFKKSEERLATMREKYDNDIETIKEKINKEATEKNRLIREQLSNSIRLQIEEEYKYTSNVMEEEIKKLRLQSQELLQYKIQIENMKMNMDNMKTTFDLDKKRAVDEAINRNSIELKNSLKNEIEEQYQQKINESIEKNQQLMKQVKDMEQKLQQGSMQIQGEAQEVELENYLRSNFNNDIINEVPKGMRGADIILSVKNEFQICGKIVIESKNTKQFNKEWIQKVKEDTLIVKGDLSIIVTKTLPIENETVSIIDDVWICSVTSFKILIFALRDGLIKYHKAKETNSNRTDKINILYNYLTSNEFKAQLDGMISGFNNMEHNLKKEKLFMEAHWKKQEKELEKAVRSAIEFYGSIKGIAGDGIPDIFALSDKELGLLG